MQAPQPQAEHQWLQKLVGEWTMESECSMGPDQPPMKSTGTEVVRSLGGLWTVGNWTTSVGEGSSQSIMTLGYDPAKKRFVGTFVSDMMTHLWPYSGTLDATGKILTLDSEGPGMSEDGAMTKYQDIIEFIDDNHRTLTSRTLGPDGKWTHFMSIDLHRKS